MVMRRVTVVESFLIAHSLLIYFITRGITVQTTNKH